jgi:oligoendopeptidase F
MTTPTPRPRASVESRYLWNAEAVFADRDAWRAEYEAAGLEVDPLAARAGTLASGPGALADVLDATYGLLNRVGRLYSWAGMAASVDTGDAEAQVLAGQAASLLARFQAAAAFVEPEVLALGRPTADAWVASEPRLASLGPWVDNLFRRQAHVRSAEVEAVLGQVTEVFRGIESTRDLLVNADLRFSPAQGGIEVAQSTIDPLMAHPDRGVRTTAWESYCDAHLAVKHTLASSLTTAFRADAFGARVRGFDSSLDEALFASALPRAVFDNTLETFRRNLPTWHRYWRVKRRALGLATLGHQDIWAPMATRVPRVTYEQGVDWVAGAVAPLGDDYARTLRRGCLEDRWVDVYPTVGKGSGAFSSGWKGTPPFILMSWSDDLSSVSTLAHELGHSMHSWMTWAHQPDIYSEYTMFAAEVASNFHQALTRAHLFTLLDDPQHQIAVIEEAMENFHRYFFLMPTLARFEFEVHQRVESGRGTTADDLGALMADLFTEGYGGEFEVDRAREGSTWAQFGHLYMKYYVFQYATGISAAHALAGPILAGEAGAVGRYREFLASGSSRHPIDALRRAGVDMATPGPMEKGFEVLSGLVDRLEALTAPSDGRRPG